MARSNAYTVYLKRHHELKLLLALGKIHLADPPTKDSLEIGVALGRAIVVLLAGHVEAFFNALMAECICDLPDNWEELSAGQKRYVALRIAEELEQSSADNETYSDPRKIDKLKGLVEKMCSWTQMPNLVINSGSTGGLKGFYRGIAPEAIETLLKRLRPDNVSFFVWIEGKGYDRSRIWIVLQQLVNERTDIAHGDLKTQPTLSDARLYVGTALFVARLADQFMREVFPGIAIKH